MVSILIFLDEVLQVQGDMPHNTFLSDEFQSLFSWMKFFKSFLLIRLMKKIMVSILIFLDEVLQGPDVAVAFFIVIGVSILIFLDEVLQVPELLEDEFHG